MVLIWSESKHFSVITLNFSLQIGIFLKNKKENTIILEYVYYTQMIFQ